MKTCKKSLAVMLCTALILVSLCAVPALGADACDCGRAPVIFVTGLNTIDIVKNLGTDEQETIFPPSQEKITAAVESALLPLATGAATSGWDGVADALIPAVNDIFADIACNDDGSIPEGQGVDWEYPVITMPHEAQYSFYYDWRTDPMVVAEQLTDFVNYVKAQTGHDKVSFIGFSLGSAILNAYLYTLNGDYSGIESVIMEVAGCNGVSCTGDPFSGAIGFDSTALVRFLDENVLAQDGFSGLVSIVLAALNESGALDGVVNFGNTAVNELSDRLYAEVLTKSFATMPGLWALIPDETYEAAKTKIFTDTEKYAALIERIDYYHYNVQLTNDDRALALYNNPDINFGIICKYGLQLTPVTQNSDVMTDGVIDTKYESFGATCADLGTTLGDGYVQKNACCGQNHVSADNMIDASTGLLPDVTWFIRDLQHSDGCSYVDALESAILYAPDQLTVFDDPSYSQFALHDKETDNTVPLTAENTAAPDDFLADLGIDSGWTIIFIRLMTLIMDAFA